MHSAVQAGPGFRTPPRCPDHRFAIRLETYAHPRGVILTAHETSGAWTPQRLARIPPRLLLSSLHVPMLTHLFRNRQQPRAMMDQMVLDHQRLRYLRLGFRLAIITVAWNVLEGVIALIAGVSAGSVALVGFGFDSFIETASGAVVGWRLHLELAGRSPAGIEQLERRTSRIAGALLFLLAAYLTVDPLRRLLGFGERPEESLLGIVLTAVSLAVMPVLGWGKLRAASVLKSGSLRADAYETIACAWLSFTTLLGLSLNAALGWWWADPAAALVLLPLIIREGLEAWHCRCCGDG